MIPAMLLVLSAHAADWPEWGGDARRNMVSSERVARSFDPGSYVPGTHDVDPSTTAGVRWVVRLGSQTYGNPTVAGGQVFLGTNNAGERRPGVDGDYSVVLAFDAATGDFQWQLSVPKLGSGKVNDWEYLGICSSPAVVDGVVYVVTNRGDVLALDADGLADGNDGVTDEGAYMAGPDRAPLALLPQDADILWRYDMREELGVFPHNITSSSVLPVGDRLYVTTSNGVDWSHLNLPSPFSPALVVLDRHTGAYIGEEASGISEHTLHSNWSSPTFADDVGEGGTVIFGGGDGFLHGFAPDPEPVEGLPALPERWRIDGNPERYRTRDGRPLEYATHDGPSEFIATPVYAEGRIYAAIGQDPEHGPGLGQLIAVDPRHPEAAAWTWDGIGRSISTVAVHKGLVFATEFEGKVHCLDAATGRVLWTHDTGSHIWGSPYIAGGVLYVGNEDGVLTVMKASKRLKILGTVDLPAPTYATPVAADGVLYVATQTHLYAVGP